MKRAWRDEIRDRWHTHQRAAESSGNAAFDEYKAETLKRLEEEQDEFADFLTNLRKARDKAEFDQFMHNRKSAPKDEPAPEPKPESGSEDTRDNPGPYSA